MKRPFSIYCTWSYHDELGDSVELTEKMCLTAMKTLRRWKEQFGVAYDYFMLDAFWFDMKRPYDMFKKPHWPNGFDRVRDEALEMGMSPGLWYSVNSNKFKVPAWKGSLDGGESYSLSHGPYAAELEKAWRHAIENWHVRLFKLDFANFFCRAEADKTATMEVFHRNVEMLHDILRRLRSEYPDLGVIAYNSFVRWGNWLNLPPGNALENGMDGSWLDVIDYLYSGDPRPSDLPRTDLRRSIDAFQDHQVWLFHKGAKLPFDRIDDHGCMTGVTNTAFYQGAHGFRRGYVANLARGGKRDIYYGDPTLIGDEDVRFIGKVRELYYGAARSGLETQIVGPSGPNAGAGDEPGVAPWYGFLTGGGASGLLYLVNGSCTVQQAQLTIPGARSTRVLFQDAGPTVAACANYDRLVVELAPEQVALVGLGTYADAKFDLGQNTDQAQPRTMTLLPITFTQSADDQWQGTFAGKLPRGAKLYVTAQVFGLGVGYHNHMGAGLPQRFGGQHTHNNHNMKPLTQELVNITLKAGGKAVKPVKLVPDKPVWSGISWVGKMYDVASLAKADKLEITVHQKLEQPKDVRILAYMVEL